LISKKKMKKSVSENGVKKPDIIQDQSIGRWRGKSVQNNETSLSSGDQNSTSIFTQPVTILDGSMGVQLCIEGLTDDALFHKIWSASALVHTSFHDNIVSIHRRHIEAGATWITTNSFGVQPTYYSRAFVSEEWEGKMVAHAELAATLAVKARKQAGRPEVRVLGCLPTICESHRPDLFKRLLLEKGEEFCTESYRKLAEALVTGGCDMFLLETINCVEEAVCGLQGIARLPEPARSLPVVLALEGAIRGLDLKPKPERAADAAREILDFNKTCGINLCGFGFNCAPPEEILASLRSVAADSQVSSRLASAGIKICAYSNINDRKKVHDNGFDLETHKMEAIRQRKDLVTKELRTAVLLPKGQEARYMSVGSASIIASNSTTVTVEIDSYRGYVDFVRKFVDNGAEIVGGCCGCGPEGIQEIAATLTA